MPSPDVNDFGATCKSAAVGAGEAVAAGAGDNTKVTGQSINRLGFGSCKVAIAYKAVLAEDETLSWAIEVQESADGSSWDTAEVIKAATVASTGGTGGTTNYGTVEYDDDLTGRKEYVRYNPTPDLSASATDTVHWGANAVLGGAMPSASQPVTASLV